MSASQQPLPDKTLLDCQFLLSIGKVQAKQSHLDHVMMLHYTDTNMLNDIVLTHCEDGMITHENIEQTMAAVRVMLDGDEQAASDYIALYMLGTLMTDIYEALESKKALLMDEPRDEMLEEHHLDAFIQHTKKDMKELLTHFSESPPLVVGITVDAYVTAMGRAFGLTEYQRGLD